MGCERRVNNRSPWRARLTARHSAARCDLRRFLRESVSMDTLNINELRINACCPVSNVNGILLSVPRCVVNERSRSRLAALSAMAARSGLRHTPVSMNELNSHCSDAVTTMDTVRPFPALPASLLPRLILICALHELLSFSSPRFRRPQSHSERRGVTVPSTISYCLRFHRFPHNPPSFFRPPKDGRGVPCCAERGPAQHRAAGTSECPPTSSHRAATIAAPATCCESRYAIVRIYARRERGGTVTHTSPLSIYPSIARPVDTVDVILRLSEKARSLSQSRRGVETEIENDGAAIQPTDRRGEKLNFIPRGIAGARLRVSLDYIATVFLSRISGNYLRRTVGGNVRFDYWGFYYEGPARGHPPEKLSSFQISSTGEAPRNRS
ncbi:hypothetical protein DBV15_01475 [Temnothorax longispinosus]|uniref:Uncharacterized protein n=1 Tax=Temnothorax longispinosus TaxID=300112 RepID=A0A4S2KYX6_9HYME|nr:hypothetical protein DBV15_01475 [Temnothorax longispinosus]